jgi:hypothetical protein
MIRSISIGLAAAAFAAVVLGSGCSDDNNTSAGTPSGKGESCTRTADCKSGLVCIGGECVTGPGGSGEDGGSTSSGGSSQTGSGGKGASSGSTSTGGTQTTAPPALGGEGESCTRRADCEDGLACILQTCRKSGSPGGDTPDGGSTSVPTLGQRGETCQSVRDCADGLTCVPRPGIAGGVCDLEEYGLMPTGKTCGGECKAAKDCCELPPNVQIVDQTTTTVVFVKSCTDIVEELLGGDGTVCDAATVSAALDSPCFYYKAYCDCAANTWTCESSSCVYTAKCTKDRDVFHGCPSRTRNAEPTPTTTCDTTTNKCQQVSTGCSTAKDCETKPVFDDPSDTCEAGECVCLDTKCYRACDADLDCAAHYDCDTKKHVCTPSAGCSSDAACAAALNDVTAVCKDDRCVVPCTTDHQCSGSGVNSNAGPFTARVCGKAGVCEPLGCASDDECTSQNGLHTFCVDAPALPTGVVRSAVTD